MNKRSFNKLVSVLLVAMMLISVIPFTASAANATQIQAASELVTGQYVIVTATTSVAPTVLDGSWVLAESVTVADGAVSATDAAVWTITVDGSTVKLQDSNGKYIAPKGGNSNGIKEGEYSWTVSADGNKFKFLGNGEDTVGFASNMDSENKFRGYKTTTLTGDYADKYPSEFYLFKVGEGEGGGEGEGDEPIEVLAEIADGDYVIVTDGKGVSNLPEDKGYGYPDAVEITVADGVASGYSATDIFTITNVEGGFTIQDSYGRYYYLKENYNSFNVGAEAPEDGHIWKAVVTDGGVIITNVLKGKTLAYSDEYSSFGIYADQSSVFNVYPAEIEEVEYESIVAIDRIWVNHNNLATEAGVTNYLGEQSITINAGDKIYILGRASMTGGLLKVVYTVNGEVVECADNYRARPDLAAAGVAVEGDDLSHAGIGHDDNAFELIGIDALAAGTYAIEIIAISNLGDEVVMTSFSLTVEGDEPEGDDDEDEDDNVAALVSSLKDGGTYVIYYNDKSLVIGTALEGNKLGGVEATPVDDKIVLADGMAVFTVDYADGEYFYLIVDGKYLTSGETGNGVSLENEASDLALWTLEETDGGWFIKNKAAAYNEKAQYLEYYNGFTTYGMNADNPQYYTFNFYEVVEAGGSNPETGDRTVLYVAAAMITVIAAAYVCKKCRVFA